ncbi:very short patch repair endonuclease [Acetobacter senegalensis]|nr:very short patch repair endonuclease [Acetobacter senegalensis]
MMAGIRGKNTRPELFIRRGLHAAGFRYRLHDRSLPGCPDLVFPGRKAAILVHGCFWHGHDCSLFRWPASRREFWEAKIMRNRERDIEVEASLLHSGWRVMTIWECALKGRGKLDADTVICRTANWLRSNEQTGEIRGETHAGR